MEFESTFANPGKQGLCGLFKMSEESYDETKKTQNPSQSGVAEGAPPTMVYKLSQYINYLVEHEYTIMNGLADISNFCPHFCKPIGVINTMIEPSNRKSGNPFDITSKYPIDKNVLLCEQIIGQ